MDDGFPDSVPRQIAFGHLIFPAQVARTAIDPLKPPREFLCASLNCETLDKVTV